MKRFFLLFLSWLPLTLVSSAEIRIGLIGLDTSHVIAFTRLLNDASHPEHVPGGKVIAAYKGGSPDIPASFNRIDGFTERLVNEFGVRLLDSIEALCSEVDAIMLTSVDGRVHLEQARPVLKAGKPMFIDKPLAGSLRDALEIFQLAGRHGAPVFTSSAYRFYDSLTEVKDNKAIGEVRSAISYGPAHIEPHHPDLFWYGVHPAEALFTIMGPGCQTVTRTHTPDSDVVTGLWENGRTGVLLGLRTGSTPHKVIAFGSKGVAEQKGGGSYRPLVQAIIRFFQDGKPPVSARETLELFAFMEAADESKRQGGKPVAIDAVLKAHAP
jgi:hypothetical protein